MGSSDGFSMSAVMASEKYRAVGEAKMNLVAPFDMRRPDLARLAGEFER